MAIIKIFRDGAYLYNDNNEMICGPYYKLVRDGGYIRACIKQTINEKTEFEETNYYWGLLDEEGNEVLEIKYDFVEKFVNGFARVKIGAFYGLIDQSAKVVIQPIYHDLGSMGEMGMYARSGSKYGVIKIVDGNKEIVHPFIYKYMRANNDGSVTLFNDCIDAVDSLNLT